MSSEVEDNEWIAAAVSGDGKMQVQVRATSLCLRIIVENEIVDVDDDHKGEAEIFFVGSTSHLFFLKRKGVATLINGDTYRVLNAFDTSTSRFFEWGHSVGSRFAAICDDEGVRCVDLESFAVSHSIETKHGEITGVCASADGKQIAVCNYGGMTSLPMTKQTLDTPGAYAVRFSPDGKSVVVLGEQVSVWDTETGRLRYHLDDADEDDIELENIADVTFTDDNEHLVLLSIQHEGIYVFDADDGAFVDSFTLPENLIHATLAPGGRYVTVLCDDHKPLVMSFDI